MTKDRVTQSRTKRSWSNNLRIRKTTVDRDLDSGLFSVTKSRNIFGGYVGGRDDKLDCRSSPDFQGLRTNPLL